MERSLSRQGDLFALLILGLTALLSFPIVSGYLLDAAGLDLRVRYLAPLVLIEVLTVAVVVWRQYPERYQAQPGRLFAGSLVFVVTLLIGLFIGWPSFLPVSPAVDAVHHYTLIDYIYRHQRLVHDLTEAANLGEMVGYPFGASLLVATLAHTLGIAPIVLLHPVAAFLLASTALFAYSVVTESESAGDRVSSHALALITLPLFLWPVAYTIGQFTRDFYLTQMLGVTCLVGLWYWLVHYRRHGRRAAFIPVISLGATLLFSYPTLLPIFALAFLVMPQFMEHRPPWRHQLADVAIVGLPLGILAILYLKDRIGVGMSVIRHDGAAISPNLETLPLGFLLLSVAGLIYATARRQLRPVSIFVWLTLLQTTAFYAVVHLLDDLSPYAAKKMFFVLTPQMAVLAGIAVVRGAEKASRAAFKAERSGNLAPACVVILPTLFLVAYTWSREFNGYDPRSWAGSLINRDILATAHYAQTNLADQRIAYFTADKITAYWIDIGLLKHPRPEFLTRPLLKPSARNYLDWYSGTIAEEYAFIPAGFEYLVGPEVETVFRNGDAGIVKRPAKRGTISSNAGRTQPAYWVGNKMKLLDITLGEQRYEPGRSITILLSVGVLDSLQSHYMIVARLRDWRSQSLANTEVPLTPLDRAPMARPGDRITQVLSLPIDASAPPGIYQVDVTFFDVNWETVRLADADLRACSGKPKWRPLIA